MIRQLINSDCVTGEAPKRDWTRSENLLGRERCPQALNGLHHEFADSRIARNGFVSSACDRNFGQYSRAARIFPSQSFRGEEHQHVVGVKDRPVSYISRQGVVRNSHTIHLILPAPTGMSRRRSSRATLNIASHPCCARRGSLWENVAVRLHLALLRETGSALAANPVHPPKSRVNTTLRIHRETLFPATHCESGSTPESLLSERSRAPTNPGSDDPAVCRHVQRWKESS